MICDFLPAGRSLEVVLDGGTGAGFIGGEMQTGYHMKPRQMRALILLLVLLPLFPAALVLRFVLDASAAEQAIFDARIEEIYDKHLRTVTAYLNDKMVDELDGLAEYAASSEDMVELIQRFRIDALMVYDASGQIDGPSAHRSARRIPLQQELEKQFPTSDFFTSWQPRVWRRITHQATLYACMVETPDGIAVAVREDRTLSARIRDFYQSSLGPQLQIRVATNTGELLAVMTASRQPVISTLALGNSLPGWTVSISLDDDSALQLGLREQTRSYRWLAGSMLLITLSISALAGWTVTRQIRLNEIRNTALAALAHELKTPLASSRLLLETLLDGRMPSQEGQQEYHEMLARENQRLARIVTNFLQLARMEQPDYRPKKELCDVGELVSSVVEPIRVRADADGSSIRIVVTDAVPLISLDHNAVASALGNLLDNALKFTPPGGEVLLEVELLDRWISFAVSDEGPGVDPTFRKEIFKPFRQVDERLSRQGEGCGLGLSIVRSVVKSHSGKITLDNRTEGGSTFTILLPVSGSVSAATPSSAPLQHQS